MWHSLGVLFLHDKQRPSAEPLLTFLECFPGDPVFSESRLSLQVCALHSPPPVSGPRWVYFFGGTDPPGAPRWGRGGGRSYGVPVLLGSRTGPACSLSHEAPLLWGVSAVGTGPAAWPLPAEAAQRCPAGVRQQASFL